MVDAPSDLDEALWCFTGLAGLRSLEVVAKGPPLLPDQLRVRVGVRRGWRGGGFFGGGVKGCFEGVGITCARSAFPCGWTFI